MPKVLAETTPTSKSTARSVTRILEDILEQAYETRASDVHIEPSDTDIRIRIRTDGALVIGDPIVISAHAELLARIKILAGLRTDEHQRPQDGRFRHELHDGQTLDIRVAITPAYFGEKAVLRLLFPVGARASLESLGMVEEHRALVLRTLAQPHGLILATGPTGSGKTSTLYALLHLLATDDRSIITIEDPIEYAIPTITQIQTNERAGLTFESGLRSILRLDPDTIMVGEIRDRETARLAVNAALTGHTVLSSLHTNDAPTALPRLLDLSVEPYLLPSTVRLIIAQRLARRICSGCRTEQALGPAEERLVRAWSHDVITTHFIGAGCATCNGTGYRGRIGVFELLPMDASLRELVLEHPSGKSLRAHIHAKGMRTLLHDGMTKARMGITTLEEAARLIYE